MKKLLCAILLIMCVVGCLALYSCGDNESQFPSETPENKPVTIELDGNNYADYFDISVEYYNYTDKSTSGTYVLGVYMPPTYKASVSQRIKITPKSNVVSLENVTFKHYANISTAWSYDSSNNGNYSENAEKNEWLISLSSNGTYDNSKTMYYCDLTREPSCPIPKSSLNICYISDVTGTITINP